MSGVQLVVPGACPDLAGVSAEAFCVFLRDVWARDVREKLVLSLRSPTLCPILLQTMAL